MATTKARLIALNAHFPKMGRDLAAELGMELSLLGIKFGIEPPTRISDIATFDTKRRRPASPQLRDRFEFASDISLGTETWLGGDSIKKAVRMTSVRRYHKALRGDWEGSAPKRYRDDQLSVFAIGEDPSDSITYLVWRADDDEPQLWTYSGQSQSVFTDLNEKIDHELRG